MGGDSMMYELIHEKKGHDTDGDGELSFHEWFYPEQYKVEDHFEL